MISRMTAEAWRSGSLQLFLERGSGSRSGPGSECVAKNSQYCANIADAASDARFALQKQALADMEKEIEGRIKVLEAKRAEYEEWLRRRNEVLEKADETVVMIYSRMRPDAAALQLINMDEEIAAAVIAKLNPRAASAVLNEMEPARAAQLANVITDAPKRDKNAVRQN